MEKTLKKYSFKEICDILDKEEEKYLSWMWEKYNTIWLLKKIESRKNTFLTSK